MATQHGARLVFDNSKALISNAGLSIQSAVLSQSYLRSEVAMSTSVTSYQIPIIINTQQGNSYSTNNLLQLQDAFVFERCGPKKEQTQSPHQRVGDWVHFRWFCPPT